MNTKIFDIKNQMRFLGIENVTQMFGACGGSGTNRNRGSSQSVVPSHIMYMLVSKIVRYLLHYYRTRLLYITTNHCNCH